jgi:hypothetical protein
MASRLLPQALQHGIPVFLPDQEVLPGQGRRPGPPGVEGAAPLSPPERAPPPSATWARRPPPRSRRHVATAPLLLPGPAWRRCPVPLAGASAY